MTRWGFVYSAIIVAMVALAGCAKKAELAPEWEALQPSCMVVLPVQNESVDEDAPRIFRRLLEARLPAKGYRVPSREFVDKILIENFDINPEEGGQIMAADPVELGKELDCDGLLYATVVQWDKKTFYAYNAINVYGTFEVLSGSDGGVLWTLREDGVTYSEIQDPSRHDVAAASTAKFLLMSYEPYAEQAIDQVLGKLPGR